LTLTAKGQLNGDLVVDGQLAVGALGISANGSLRVSGHAGPSAGLNLKIVNANIRSPRPSAPDRSAELLPTSVSASVDLTDQTLFTEVAGTVAGTSVAGRVVLRNQQPMTLDGDIDIGTLDLPAAIAVAIGIPSQPTGANGSTGAGALGKALGFWPAEPFERGLLRIGGQIAVKAARVPLTPKLAARDVRGVLRIGESQLALQVIDGNVAGGRMVGELVFLRQGEGLIARSRVRLTGANAAEMLPGEGLVSGKLAFDVSAEGTGMSVGALIGSLDGGGNFTLENGRLARLDPAAFEAVIRAVDRGLPIDATSVRDKIESALASGGFVITRVGGPIVINAGQARLSNTIVRAPGADLTIGGSVDLTEGTLEARLLLFGTGGAGSPLEARPEIAIALRGPVNAPKRTIDAAALANWLALRAVEQQARKLDALEGREGAPPPPAPPAANFNTQPTPN
jgi:large subunit ribosomal protein L24